jgi:adenylate kinase
MILFFGPAGSGKSAQAQMLVDNNGFKWFSMGQLLRDTTDTEVHGFQQRGELVPIEKTNQVLSQALGQIKSDDKLILDGYPRQLDQAKWLLEKCKVLGIPIQLAIHFDVDMEELLKRMQLRGRADDTPDSINQRLAIYHKEIDPILNYLSDNKIKVEHIDGIGSFEDIHDRVKNTLTEFNLL